MNIKEQLSMARQKFGEDFAEVIEKFQTDTGLTLNGVYYNQTVNSDNRYPKIHVSDIRIVIED